MVIEIALTSIGWLLLIFEWLYPLALDASLLIALECLQLRTSTTETQFAHFHASHIVYAILLLTFALIGAKIRPHKISWLQVT